VIKGEVVEQIQRLLAEGVSRRQVAKLTGVSRQTVNDIASGRRPDYAALRRAREERTRKRAGPVKRCPGCGHLVRTPCLICEARFGSERRIKRWPALRLADDRPHLRLDLKEPHRVRYEQLRARKIRERQQVSAGQNALDESDSGNER